MLQQCVAKKMSWASGRTTTRTEDLAYCLLGLFNIQMALLYGEGSNAFARLQEEIVRQTDDESIFAWGLPLGLEHEGWKWDAVKDPGGMLLRCPSVLAPHPKCFQHQGRAHLAGNMKRQPYRITNKGLEFRSQALELFNPRLSSRKVVVIELNCGNIVSAGGEQQQPRDRSCLMALHENHQDRYERLELDPRRATTQWYGDEYLWHYISGQDAERTSMTPVESVPFYIQAMSSARSVGRSYFDDKNFLTLSKLLAEKEKRRSRALQGSSSRDEYAPHEWRRRGH